MKKNNRIGLIKVEVFANLDSLSEEHNKIEIETKFEFKEKLIKKEVKELVDKFTSGLNNYLNDETEEQDNVNCEPK